MEVKPTQFFLDQVRLTKEKADRIIKIELPKKICNLNEYIENVQHEFLQCDVISQIDVSAESVECNKVTQIRILELNASLKQEMIDYLEIYDVLQMWIVYNKAPYDNGHPIGEEVQNELYNSLENGKDSAVEMFNALKSYHRVRADSIQNSRKNMHVADLVECIRSLDASQLESGLPLDT
ncbi:hypothetical protein JH06_2334 [Blastocystis sp. subtype 4]|uniref:hypothetical protein n=1 Tax=Blastocystis sp. subtype 4 TaxID=944170 RepID=UPI0007112DD2|nr:hypothetical protein JH06_2334 [Blastocystis sp. subtype 4]KNB43952.1 hypothetical protein JH06_2334 [Blastocystis sp. subtype 4]|eukprot:XP_014527395.1 hypothetical protein JH06_2334 [Blastocystis sp. subtype 4]